MNNDLGGLLFNGQKRPNRVAGVDGVAADGDFDPNTDRYFDRAAWTDPGPLPFGNAPKRDGTVRGFPVYSEDLNIFKVFPLPQRPAHPVRVDVRQHLQPDAVLRSRTRTGVRAPISARSRRNAISRGRYSLR